MKFDKAMFYLRGGKKIRRKSAKDPENCLKICGAGVLCSYLMTVYDVLGDDWEVVNDKNDGSKKD